MFSNDENRPERVGSVVEGGRWSVGGCSGGKVAAPPWNRLLSNTYSRRIATHIYGTNIYNDTKPKMVTLLVFNRVNRLEIQSVRLVFSTLVK
jgi:hypothetical protein